MGERVLIHGDRDVYRIEVAGVTRDFRIFRVTPEGATPAIEIAIVNILGDTELIEKTAAALAEQLAEYKDQDVVLMSAEAKSEPLLYELAKLMGKPWVVLRKSYKPYMGNAISATTVSITTQAEQTLYLDEKDLVVLKDKEVILVDDVISTGSTMDAMKEVSEKAGGTVVVRAAIFTEGNSRDWEGVVALDNLPVWVDGQ